MFTIRTEQMAVLAMDFAGANIAARLAADGFETCPGELPGEVLVKDRRGKQARLQVDHRGRVVQLLTPLGFRYLFEYDAQHRLTGVTSPNGLRTTATYNDNG